MTLKGFVEGLSKYGFSVALFTIAIASAVSFGRMAEKMEGIESSVENGHNRINERLDRHFDNHN